MEWFPEIWNGTLREHYLLLFGTAGGIAVVTGFMSAWIGAQIGARRAARQALREAREQALSESRTHARSATSDELARVSQAIDAIAVEVERIAEAQRFTARMLAERVNAQIPSPRREPGQITPH